MDRPDRPNPAAGVRFVTGPDGHVTAEHVETGESATGETAVDALEALYAASAELEPPEAGLGAGAASDTAETEWEWIDATAIEEARGTLDTTESIDE